MWESLRTVRVYLWRYRRGLALGLGSLVLKDVAGAVQPLVIRAAVDALAPAFGLARLLRFAGLLVGLALVKGIFQYWMRVIIISISRDIEYDLRNDLFRHLVDLSPDYYGRTRTGDIMARSTNDLNAVRMMLGPGIMYWTETSLTFLLAIIIMVSVDWRLALFAVLPAPLVSMAVIFFGRAIHLRFERIQAMFSDISSRVQENLAGVRMVRAFAQEQAELRHFEKLNREYIKENIRLVRISGVFQPLLEALIGLTFLVVLWYGGTQVLNGRISLGSFVMFNTYMGILVWPMIALGWVVNLMQRGRASLERINQIFREKPSISTPPHPISLANVRGEIEFRGASMAYQSGLALDQIDLRIEAGTTVAVVGHTGSGKSTLVSLVPRLMDPTEGVCCSTASTCVNFRPPNCAAKSVSFHKRRSYLVPRSPETSRSVSRALRTSRSVGRPDWPVWPATSSRFPMAIRPWSASVASPCRAARSSAPPSPARSCAIRGF